MLTRSTARKKEHHTPEQTSKRPVRLLYYQGIKKAGGSRTPAELVVKTTLFLRVDGKLHRAKGFYSGREGGQGEKSLLERGKGGEMT